MNFLEIPEEVIEGHLLPFLKWNDLLRFRRVCKVTKAITDGFLAVNPDLAPEIEINEEDQSFGAFLDMGIPTRKMYLKNVSGIQFYEKDEDDIAVFSEKYGGIITTLRVHQLSLRLSKKELNFMAALTNLESLEITHFFYGVVTDHRRLSDAQPPDVIRGLKVLKIGQKENVWQGIRGKLDLLGLHWMNNSGASLEYISLPFTSHTEPWDSSVPGDSRDPQFSLKNVFQKITSCVKDHEGNKTIDFANFHDPTIPMDVHWNGSTVFGELSKACHDNGVKLKNVSAKWCNAGLYAAFQSLQDAPIVSLMGLQPFLSAWKMPTLERIEIKATSTNSIGQKMPWQPSPPKWRNLKELDITVDSKKSECVYFLPANGDYMPHKLVKDTKLLFTFFFQDEVCPGLAQLRLNFTKEADSVAIPKTREIVSGCPNLTKLTLINWPGTNKALIELFSGLPKLKEVSLEYCKGLGNVAFVGLDTSRPVFFKLKSLKKLSLKGLDQTPKITDLLFSMVLCHLSLTHLLLTSDAPLKSVTSRGIRALLQGTFAQSIEKFSFQNFSLEGVSSEEFKELEKQFRSYDML